jgi:hypothetical protein
MGCKSIICHSCQLTCHQNDCEGNDNDDCDDDGDGGNGGDNGVMVAVVIMMV